MTGNVNPSSPYDQNRPTSTTRPNHRSQTTGAYVGSLAASVALDGPALQAIRKMLADAPHSSTQLQLKLGADNPVADSGWLCRRCREELKAAADVESTTVEVESERPETRLETQLPACLPDPRGPDNWASPEAFRAWRLAMLKARDPGSMKW